MVSEGAPIGQPGEEAAVRYQCLDERQCMSQLQVPGVRWSGFRQDDLSEGHEFRQECEREKLI